MPAKKKGSSKKAAPKKAAPKKAASKKAAPKKAAKKAAPKKAAKKSDPKKAARAAARKMHAQTDKPVTAIAKHRFGTEQFDCHGIRTGVKGNPGGNVPRIFCSNITAPAAK